MIVAKKALPRRTFLRGSGTMLALPLLDAMVPAHTATAATAADPARLRRLGFVFMPMGCDLGRDTPLPSLELSMNLLSTVGQCDNGYACVYQNNLSWSSPTTPLPSEAHPRIVFERLLAGVTAGRPAPGADAPVVDAAERGGAAAVRGLLDRHIDPKEVQADGMTALHWAARRGDLELARLLLGAGVDVRAANRYGVTPLALACTGGDPALVDLLLAAGADPNAPLAGGETPLMTAARTGTLGPIRSLLARGVDVNGAMQITRPGGAKPPARGTSPLILAVENGHFDLAALLLDLGADPNDQRSGSTALHTLTWVRKPNRGDDDSGDPAPIGSGTMTSLQLVTRLVEHQGDVNARLARGASGRGVLNRAGRPRSCWPR